MIAEAAASVPLCLYDGPHEIEEHPARSLIERPTPTSTRAEFFETLIGFLLVSGNAYVEASALNGELRELHILRPAPSAQRLKRWRIQIVPGEDGWHYVPMLTRKSEKSRTILQIVTQTR
jgi:phage portal protein BeeE